MFNIVPIFVLAYAALGDSAEMLSLPADKTGPTAEALLDCITEVGAPPDTFDHILAWNINDKNLDVTKKFLYCFGTKLGYVNKDGDLNIDYVVSLAGTHKLKDAFREHLVSCDKLGGSDHLDKTYKRAECFVTKSPVVFTV